jgi:hypothetical protein
MASPPAAAKDHSFVVMIHLAYESSRVVSYSHADEHISRAVHDPGSSHGLSPFPGFPSNQLPRPPLQPRPGELPVYPPPSSPAEGCRAEGCRADQARSVRVDARIEGQQRPPASLLGRAAISAIRGLDGGGEQYIGQGVLRHPAVGEPVEPPL